MTVALSCQKLREWIGNAIEGFRSNDLLGVPEPWLQIYESLADYISSGTPIDQKLSWMLEGTDDSLADVIYQLQRLKGALVTEIIAAGALDELNTVLSWFDQTIVTLVERASGKLSEERSLSVPYETVFWKARDGMYISTIEGKFLHCNQALMDMMKFESIQDLLTLDIRKDMYVDHDKRKIMLDHLHADGFFDHHEFKFKCADGEIKTALESCYLVDLPNGRRFIVGIMVDVTEDREIAIKREEYVKGLEKKRMESHFSLRQIARRFDALQKVNDHPVVLVEPKTFKFINNNPAFTKRFKYNKKSLERLTFRDLFAQRDWMAIFTQISNAIHRMQYHIPKVTCITYEDETFSAALSIVTHQDDLGAALFVQIEDCTEVDQLEARLSEAEDNHEKMMEGAPIGIMGFRSDGTVGFVNKYLCERVKYKEYQLKNLSFVNKLFASDEHQLKFNKYIRRFLRGQHAENVDIELLSKKGDPVQFMVTTIPHQFEGEKKKGFLALLSDVSHRLELEARRNSDQESPTSLEQEFRNQTNQMTRLEERYNDLRRKAMFRQDFLKVLAKKFKVPIHVVLGFASLLKKDLSNMISESQQEDINIIERHIGFVLNMLEKAVEFSHLEDEDVQVMPEYTLVRNLLDELFERLIPRRLPPKVAFSAEHHILSVDLKIETDAQILESLLRHIVDNAVDFTKSGLIEVSGFEDDNSLWIEVRDSGAGIDPTEVGHVFDPFFQAGGERDPDQSGLGLGLAIARRYADLIGAEIEVHSQLNCGSKFLVRVGDLVND